MVQPVENIPGVLDGPIVNGDIAPEADRAAPADPAAPPAADDAAPAPAPAAPEAPAAAPADPAAAPADPGARPARPVGLPGPRRRPILRAAQLLGTDSLTCQLLSGLPVVEFLSRRGQLQHRRLVQVNWVYMMVFVCGAFLYKAARLSTHVGGTTVGRAIDASLFNLLTSVVDRYPFLRVKPGVMRRTTKNLLHGNEPRSWLGTVSVSATFAAIRPVVLGLSLFSLCLRLWTEIITRLWEIMNDDRTLAETELGQVAPLFVGKAVSLFWRLPFNVFYNWVAIPMLIHPGEFVQYLHDQLQDLILPDVPGGDGADIEEMAPDEAEDEEDPPEAEAAEVPAPDPEPGQAPVPAGEGGDPAQPNARDPRAAA